MAQSPCFLSPPSNPLYLLGNPPSCDRIRPLWSQVACKLTSPFFLNPFPIPPPSKFPEPRLLSASLWRPQESGFSCPEHILSWQKKNKKRIIRQMSLKFEYLGEFEFIFENNFFTVWIRGPSGYVHWKTRSKKSHASVPLKWTNKPQPSVEDCII